MNPSREEALFEQALAKPVKERAAFLDGACFESAGLRQRIEALLAAHDAETGFLPDNQSNESSATLLDESTFTEGSGTQIGRYKLLEKLGEGGFGSVWAAEQKEPVRRRVALKIIKLGMDTKQVVARFEAERQALALMDHPNIAKVLDAGATDTGRPYFVMELVKGMAITKYCNQEKLDTNARLDLFIKVCQAIQHAHQKGIIHRDIKPSNVMITLHDGVPVPMVIDFGIAKATQQELTEKTIYTQYSQFIGTPAYMSPEQAEMSGLDIDTRSDIYSLGVLLYELLTGSTPFDSKELMQSGLDEMRKIIREREPVRPSTRLSQTLVAAEVTRLQPNDSKAEKVRASSRRLLPLIPSDLDWIAMKCLEKDRGRRYDTANALSMDINRHLKNEPVTACPPTAAYRIRKAWRRNKLAYTAATAVSSALIIGLAFSAWQATLATRAKNTAIAAEGAKQEALQLAEKDRDRAVRSADELRKQIYVSDIGLAHRAIQDGNLARAKSLLSKSIVNGDEEDLRGFEWRHLWSQTQGGFEADLGPYTGYLSGATISPDGQFVALNRSEPTRIEIIHVASGAIAKSMNIPGWVSPLAYSPSGDFLIGHLLSKQNRMIGWNTRTWAELEPIELSSPFAFGRRGTNEILLARKGNQLSMWDLASWESFGDLRNTTTDAPLVDPSYGLDYHMDNSLAVSHHGDVAYLAGAQKIRRWDLNRKIELAPFIVAGMACLATSNKGQLAGADAVGNVHLIDPHSGEILHSSRSHTAWTTSLQFTADGTRLISANQDRSLVVHNSANGSIVSRLLGHRYEVTALDIADDGQTIISGGFGGSVFRWKWAGSENGTFDLSTGKASSILADGRILMLRENKKTLEHYDPIGGVLEPAHGGQLVDAMSKRPVEPIAFSPSSKWALVIDGSQWVVRNTFTGEAEQALTHPSGNINGALFSPDSRFLMTSGEKEVRIWRTDDWTSKSLGPRVDDHLNWGAFSGDGHRVAIAASDRSIHVYDNDQELSEIVLENSSRVGFSVALSRDGRWLAGGTGKASVLVWNLETKKPVSTLQGHSQGVISLCFSPNDRTLVSFAGAKMMFWNTETWQELMSFQDEVPPRGVIVPRIKFSPNGRYLARMGAPIGETQPRFRFWLASSFSDERENTRNQLQK